MPLHKMNTRGRGLYTLPGSRWGGRERKLKKFAKARN